MRSEARPIGTRDEDDIADANEGVEGATVTIQGGSIDTVVETDSTGVWRMYVPILENYTITVEKDGFGVVSYDDNNSGTYVVDNEPVSQDIEMSAAEVTVTGSITDVLDASRLEDATITLYGTSENQQDSVEVVGTFADETLSFAVVEPGQWVVVVYEDDAPFNGGGVTVGLLDAEVQNGGTIELVMSKGGWVDLQPNSLRSTSKHSTQERRIPNHLSRMLLKLKSISVMERLGWFLSKQMEPWKYSFLLMR